MAPLTFDALVIGAGFAGAVSARELAERGGRRVLLLERRGHIAGNAYDRHDGAGILVHEYGPHIFHTNDERVHRYLSRFTKWRAYEHRVAANLFGTQIPVPFNLTSLALSFDAEKAPRMREKLIKAYGADARVTILSLREQKDPELLELADFIYENIFLHYTMKQWGTRPEEIDPNTTARVPVLVSEDDRYFQDQYQGMPQEGYTALFKRLLDHPNLETRLCAEAREHLSCREDGLYLDGVRFDGPVIYTGALDELFDLQFGALPYRTLDFQFETHDISRYQDKGTVNYTVSEAYTRITEFKHLTGQVHPKTSIVKEFSRAYTGKAGETPYYAIPNAENNGMYERYARLASKYQNFYPLGRLAEYQYYNMDVIVSRALALCDKILLKVL